MCKFNKKNDSRFIDPCMRRLIANLEPFINGEPYKIVACCCGHRKYPMTIVIKSTTTGEVIEMCNSKKIPRQFKFYKKDKQGYYYIPETISS